MENTRKPDRTRAGQTDGLRHDVRTTDCRQLADSVSVRDHRIARCRGRKLRPDRVGNRLPLRRLNSAILEREKAVMLDDGIHYAYLDEDGYTDEGVVEALFSDCLLLGEETLNALRGIASVSELALIPPTTLEDFPHCQCQVMATISMLTQFIQDDLL